MDAEAAYVRKANHQGCWQQDVTIYAVCLPRNQRAAEQAADNNQATFTSTEKRAMNTVYRAYWLSKYTKCYYYLVLRIKTIEERSK